METFIKDNGPSSMSLSPLNKDGGDMVGLLDEEEEIVYGLTEQ